MKKDSRSIKNPGPQDSQHDEKMLICYATFEIAISKTGTLSPTCHQIFLNFYDDVTQDFFSSFRLLLEIIELGISNPCVAGSSPARRTSFSQENFISRLINCT